MERPVTIGCSVAVKWPVRQDQRQVHRPSGVGLLSARPARPVHQGCTLGSPHGLGRPISCAPLPSSTAWCGEIPSAFRRGPSSHHCGAPPCLKEDPRAGLSRRTRAGLSRKTRARVCLMNAAGSARARVPVLGRGGMRRRRWHVPSVYVSPKPPPLHRALSQGGAGPMGVQTGCDGPRAKRRRVTSGQRPKRDLAVSVEEL